MKVLNFGSLNLDYVYTVDHFVRPGETLASLRQEVKAGGKGLNQSVALARAGIPVIHGGCAGIGGGMLKELLEKEGVDCTYLRETSEIQGNAVIQVTKTGENAIILFGGSNLQITEEQIRDTLAAAQEGDYLLLQNEINGNEQIVEQAYARGMKIFLNPSPYNERLCDVDFGKISWIIVNEIEAEQITGRSDPEEVFACLHERYPGLSVLITLGALGSVAFEVKGEDVHVSRQAVFPVTAVDTTGAGDTYTGYFIAGLMRGNTPAEAMKQAGLASALCVTRHGAADSVPYASEVQEYFRESDMPDKQC